MAPGVDGPVALVNPYPDVASSGNQILRSISDESQHGQESNNPSHMVKVELPNDPQTPSSESLLDENVSLLLQLETLRQQRGTLEAQLQAAEEREAIRAAIAEEHRLISITQQRIQEADHRAASVRSEEIHESRRLKRKRSYSPSQDLDNDRLPRINFGFLRDGHNILTLKGFLEKIENFFEQYVDVYTNDRRKIRTATTAIDEGIRIHWESYVFSRRDWEPNWHDFTTFLRNRAADIRAMKKAIALLAHSRQSLNQPVVAFSATLETWQCHFPPQNSFEKKETLRVRVNKRLKKESEKPSWTAIEPESYPDFVLHLSKIEKYLKTGQLPQQG
ncbi:hypothetical protein BGW36DRAFT_365670 [Talaromyces proteolyticus]|uniref:Uncharacterized protein n=1 Tax=Talaromyces proteolyticus TaxID=1131652 RepID=A0AAD4KID4_9EURO|nr:uncharacterized protein BGW36DRAFT_365670 [Talaromyces proteolyticus]KAH8689138.1 hypothetical protein BGW36DRAFT_365670 [Talaromyces proteolyticus]